MSIICLGLNHHSAPLRLLEKVSFGDDEMRDALGDLRKKTSVKELVGLSTCNRTEFYFVSPQPAAAQDALLAGLVAMRPGADEAEIRSHSYIHKNDLAAKHLFRVAAGVDSLMVGETQILGQIRRSYEMAIDAGCVGGMLNTLMLQAISFGRRVRVETAIGKGNVSVASIALKIVRNHCESLAGKSLLILGAGETAQIAARQFVKDGIERLIVLNRTDSNADALRARIGAGEVTSADSLEAALAGVDFVVCATSAPGYLLRAETLARAQAQRAGKPLIIIDLSMPRNIDPECDKEPGVRLFALENLEEIARENKLQRRAEIAQVERMVTREADTFMRWTQSVDADRLVNVIRKRAQATRASQLQRHGKKLSAEERARTARFSDTLLRAVLHDVTKNIRSIDLDSETSIKEFDTICRLFNVTRKDLQWEET